MSTLANKNKSLSVILAAAGESARFDGTASKQFALLNGKPILIYSIEKFLSLKSVSVCEIVVVTNDIKSAEEIINDYFYTRRSCIRLVQGGKLRQDSVYNGFCSIDPLCNFVLIHDACRPLFDLNDVKRCIEKAFYSGAAILASPVIDTIKKGVFDNDEIYVSLKVPRLDRKDLFLIQTPQVIRYDLLSKAYKYFFEKGKDSSKLNSVYSSFTDEAGMIEHLGEKVSIVVGSRKNIKITYKEDLEIANAILNERGRLEVRNVSNN